MINSKSNNSVNEMFEAAHSCFNYWKSVTVKQRVKFLRKLREVIVEKQKEILHCIISDTSKPVTEIVNQEITATLAMLKFMEKSYPNWLKPKNF